MLNSKVRGYSLLPSPGARLTLRPLWVGPTVQPHHHGGKGHLALHAVLPDGIDDSSWKVDVQVTEEDNAVWILGCGVGEARSVDLWTRVESRAAL